MSELSMRARALGEKLLRLRAKGTAGPGLEEVAEVLLLCASELDRMAQGVSAGAATWRVQYLCADDRDDVWLDSPAELHSRDEALRYALLLDGAGRTTRIVMVAPTAKNSITIKARKS